MKGNTTGTDNVSYGGSALMCNTTGCYNVAIGQSALRLSTTTSFNLAIGPGALQSQVAGASVNVMIGAISGRDLTCAHGTVALGAATLSCAICSDNTVAIGTGALQYACGYINNSVFIGSTAGHSCCSGVSLKTQCSCYDIAIGFAAMCHPAGCRNVVIGADAVRFTCLTGVRNVIMGSCSGYQISSGSCNVIIGDYAGIGANANNGVAIGYNASVETNTIILGNGNHTVARMNPAGWSSLSDSRYKKNISYVCNALSIVKKLNPVYYTMCAELGDRLSIGMIAQEVKEVFDPSKFSIIDFSNGRYGIRYNDFISLNTSAIKELNSCLESQQCEIYYYQQCINSMKECISCFENRLSCIEKMLSGE
jgi:trimeric autotransporter adhesin